MYVKIIPSKSRDGYNYFNGGAVMQAQIVANYLSTQWISDTTCPTKGILNGQDAGIAPRSAAYSSWASYASYCAGLGGSSCPYMKGIMPYEGGFALGGQNGLVMADKTVTITASNNSSSCTLTPSPIMADGAVAGMTVTITSASGGTWSTVVGNSYIVQEVPTLTSIPINLDCSRLVY